MELRKVRRRSEFAQRVAGGAGCGLGTLVLGGPPEASQDSLARRDGKKTSHAGGQRMAGAGCKLGLLVLGGPADMEQRKVRRRFVVASL